MRLDPPRHRVACWGIYVDRLGTVQVHLGRLHLSHYRMPWWPGVDARSRRR